MPGLGALWDSLVDCICRPPRDDYIYPDELVGGHRKLFRVGHSPGVREDLTLVNKRGLRLQCSHYLPRHVRGRDGRLPCVIYCHCNSGSRRDAEEAICVLIPIGVSVFTLDFAGSGLSEGQWVTLGAEEVDDVAVAVEHLRGGGRVSTLGLWGRSMGAVTALLYSQRDPSIAGMVLDSPFSRLTDLMLEIVQEQRLPIPRPLVRLALAAMKRSVMKRAGFDITKVSPLDAVPQSFIPALFGHATSDSFIRITHTEALSAAYAGDKNVIRFEGDHNSRRPESFYKSVSVFWHNTLQLEALLEPADLQTGLPAATQSTAAGAAAGASAGSRSAPRHLRPLGSRARQMLGPPAGPIPMANSTTDPSRGDVEAAAGRAGPADGSGSGAGGNADGEDEGADVACPGTLTRSAPWEPRLMEIELDKTLRERQRFRRMTGGLPSPAAGPSSTAFPATTAGVASSNSDLFRRSGELAAGRNDSGLARLLGQEPMWPDADALGQPSAAGRGPMAPPTDTLGAAADDPDSLAAALLLLPPGSEEEEEAQLRAALQLSLLEVAAEAAPAQVSAPGAGATAADTGHAAGGSGLLGSEREPGLVSEQDRIGEQQQLLQQDGVGWQPSGQLASGTDAVAGQPSLPAVFDASAAAQVVNGCRQEDPVAHVQQPTRTSAVMSAQQLMAPKQDACLPSCQGNSAPPPSADITRAASAGGDGSGGSGTIAPRSTKISMPMAAARAAVSEGMINGSAFGPDLYDIYSEDELLAMAVQLSLQEGRA